MAAVLFLGRQGFSLVANDAEIEGFMLAIAGVEEEISLDQIAAWVDEHVEKVFDPAGGAIS